MTTTTTTVQIEGRTILVDRSGVGHCWVRATDLTCPVDIQTEIAAEMSDGGQAKCDAYTASNGVSYRW